MTEDYVTWDEKKYSSYFMYIITIRGNSIAEIKQIIQNEQDYRRLNSRPHMFSVKITKKRPDADEIERRKRGHLYC